MTSPRTKFYKDRQNARWSGVCAGIADYTGIDVNVVRTTFVLGTVFSGGGFFLAYLIIAWMTPDKPNALYEKNREDQKFWQSVRANPRRTARAVRSQLRNIDRRLADVEAYVTSSNHRLASEIERLR